MPADTAPVGSSVRVKDLNVAIASCSTPDALYLKPAARREDRMLRAS